MAGAVNYYSIQDEGEGLYKEKGSKFFAHSYPVKDLEEVRARLDELRKRYHDARHHCYAYHLGVKQPIIRANDDGEPNHSAGDPILGQIRSFNLTNVLVVVIRYFGGTKLGVGGLIHAYKTAAFEALSGLPTVEVFETFRFQIEFSYEETPYVERLISQFEVTNLSRSYEASCKLEGAIRQSDKDRFQRLSSDLQVQVLWMD